MPPRLSKPTTRGCQTGGHGCEKSLTTLGRVRFYGWALIVARVAGFTLGQLFAPEFMRRLAARSGSRDDLRAKERAMASVAVTTHLRAPGDADDRERRCRAGARPTPSGSLREPRRVAKRSVYPQAWSSAVRLHIWRRVQRRLAGVPARPIGAIRPPLPPTDSSADSPDSTIVFRCSRHPSRRALWRRQDHAARGRLLGALPRRQSSTRAASDDRVRVNPIAGSDLSRLLSAAVSSPHAATTT